MNKRIKWLLIGLLCLSGISLCYHGYWILHEYQTYQRQLQKGWTRFTNEYTYQLNRHTIEISPLLRSITRHTYLLHLHTKDDSSNLRLLQYLWSLYKDLRYIQKKYHLPYLALYRADKTLLFILTQESDYLYFPSLYPGKFLSIRDSDHTNILNSPQHEIIEFPGNPLSRSFIQWESHYMSQDFHVWQHHIVTQSKTLGYVLFFFPFPQSIYSFVETTFKLTTIPSDNDIFDSVDIPTYPITSLQHSIPYYKYGISHSMLLIKIPGKHIGFQFIQQNILFKILEICMYYGILFSLGYILYRSSKQYIIQQDSLLHFLLDFIPNTVIFIKSNDGEYLYQNKAFQVFYKKYTHKIYLHNDDLHVLKGEIEQDQEEYISGRVFLSSKYPLYDSHNHVYGIAFIKKDVTDIIFEREKYLLATQMITKSLILNNV